MAESMERLPIILLRKENWTREQKLEFVEWSYLKSMAIKNKAAKEFQSHHKVEINSTT